MLKSHHWRISCFEKF